VILHVVHRDTRIPDTHTHIMRDAIRIRNQISAVGVITHPYTLLFTQNYTSRYIDIITDITRVLRSNCVYVLYDTVCVCVCTLQFSAVGFYDDIFTYFYLLLLLHLSPAQPVWQSLEVFLRCLYYKVTYVRCFFSID